MDDSELNKKDFYNKIYIDKFVLIRCHDSDASLAKDKKIIGFYITHVESGITRTVSEFKKLMSKVPKDIKDIYIISDKDFSQQVYNTIKFLFSNYYVMKLNNIIFEFEVPKHMLVSKHEILNDEECKNVQKNLTIINRLNLSKIRMDDPQCIWIGAKPKDIIKITRFALNGESINYRVVVGPVSLKVKNDYNPDFVNPKQYNLGSNGKIIITRENIIRTKEEKERKSLIKKNKQQIKKKTKKKV